MSAENTATIILKKKTWKHIKPLNLKYIIHNLIVCILNTNFNVVETEKLKLCRIFITCMTCLFII